MTLTLVRRTLTRSFALTLVVASAPLGCTSEDGDGSSAAGMSAGGSGAGQGSGGANAGKSGAPATTAGSAAGGKSNAGGAAGNAGSSSAGMSAGGAAPGTASPGCGMAAGQELNKWLEQPKLNVAGTDRQWWVWLPAGYDPSHAYPVIFNFHGCSSSDNIVPMQKVAGDKAILVRATGITDNVCWDAAPDGDDVTFFDQMLADVVAKRCADTTRVFATGYSSGSWLANTLECVRGDKLRAIGTVSGGTFGNKDACKGKYARIFIHDQDDHTNEIMAGNDDERDRLIQANHCMAEGPVMEAPAPCARYQGCDAGYPVIWCQTQTKGHDRQDSLAPGAFWGLFSSL